MATVMNEVNNDKTEVQVEVIFVVFRLFVLLSNSSKLINNRCTVHVSL